MPELKRTFTKGKMNKDVDERMVPKGEYVDALNIEINTSEGSDVGTVQALKGNVAITSLFSSSAKCVGTVVKESNNKLYWFITDPVKNEDASSGTHSVFSNYIMEYDDNDNTQNYIVVENYKVETTVSQGTTEALFVYVSSIVGIQVGMTITLNNQTYTINSIKQQGDYYQLWVDTKVPCTTGDSISISFPSKSSTLGFHHIPNNKLITGINIIDDLLFWTDNISEPRKINIERCRYGSQQALPSTYPNGTRLFPTLLIVNGDVPSTANGRIDSSVSGSIPLSYRETTVIKKSPLNPPKLTMSNSLRGDVFIDGQVVVDTIATLPNSDPTITDSTDFFFNSGGALLSTGSTTTSLLTLSEPMDWNVGDIIEFYPDDDDAGTSNDILATCIITSNPTPGIVWQMTIQSISKKVVKPFTQYKLKLQQGDPLFEFKFPRFAYRWKYEDGEYSTYSPFSQVAFLPDQFDYLPKKGFNLGMTNNVRRLIISDFKPKHMPLDVVEIDIVYKESTSPNVYTVETIKSPSLKINSLKTNTYAGDTFWFGKIDGKEIPNSTNTYDRLVATNIITSPAGSPPNVGLTTPFPDTNIKVGDKIEWVSNTSTGITGTATILTITVNANGTDITIGDDGTQVNASGSLFGLVEIYRESPGASNAPAQYLSSPAGSFLVKSDMIHATLPSNQLLRPWDNVPRKALAQDVTKNRIVYGNYLQNYNLEDNVGEVVNPTFDILLSTRANIRENVRFDDSLTLRDPSTASTVNWYDLQNQLVEQVSFPERSLKSLRDYQVGVVFMDEFGRQTPIQTHDTGLVRIPKSRANTYNQFRIHINKDYNSFTMPSPSWATHYKYYIKEISNEYYNLAMDRFYPAEDGNVWLSFPSSERNKVDEETFLILKKQHDNDTFVQEDARYKILAISNEAPLFIKSKVDSFGLLSTTFPASGEPKYQQQHIDLPDSYFNGGSYQEILNENNKIIRVTNPNTVSLWYDVVSIADIGSVRRVTVRKPFGVDMSFTTDDGLNSGAITTNLSVEMAIRKVKTLPEFLGRFFVKIYKDGVFEKNILSQAPENTLITTSTMTMGQSSKITPNLNNWPNLAGVIARRNRWVNGATTGEGSVVPHKTWFVTNDDPDNNGGDTSPILSPFTGAADSSLTLMYYDVGDGGTSFDWGITNHGNNVSANAQNLLRAKKMRTNGQLFRFKGDDTVYKITTSSEHSVKVFSTGDTYGYGDETSNRAVVIKFNFEPPLNSSSNVLDARGKNHTGYDPRFENTEGTNGNTYGIIATDTWQGTTSNASGRSWATGGDATNNEYRRTIEFLEEFPGDSSYTSDNPAIWETEPKESVDLDLYHEASQAFSIDKEWNAFENKFDTTSYWTSYNNTNYYNCFSFANGVESNRIRDDYNAPTIDKGPKVSTVLAEQYKEEYRKSGLIYSGLYNSITGINNLNQFIQAEKITKDLNPTYGSVQRLYAKETNLNVLCEDRIIKVLANKDALYNADGNVNLTSTNNVLGAATPYSGDYGISTDPESFAKDQYRSYFTDRARGVVIRLSNDGITPISEYGMTDYFKDALKVSNSSLIGSYDENKDIYNLTITAGSKTTTYATTTQEEGGDPTTTTTNITNSNDSSTVSFSEKSKGWSTFQSWEQETGIGFNKKYFTFKTGELYIHHENETRNNFYGVDNNCSICFTINDSPESIKNFSSLSYEGTKSKVDQFTSITQDGREFNDGQYFNLNSDTGWYAESIETDLETGHIPEFRNKEGKWFNFIKGNKENTLANLDVSQFSTQGIGTPTSVSSTSAQVNVYTFRVNHKATTAVQATVTNYSALETSGDSPSTTTFPSTVSIVFTPVSPNTLDASQFSYDPSLPSNSGNTGIITSGAFSDNSVALSAQNSVTATFTISNGYVMPSNNVFLNVYFDVPVNNSRSNINFTSNP